MTSKQSALEKLSTMQTPEPKRRRTAQEQALAPLLKERAKLTVKHAIALANAEELGEKISRIDRMIDAIRETDDDDQEPESE